MSAGQERNPDCLACSKRTGRLEFPGTARLQEVLDYLVNSPQYQMRAPGVTTVLAGKNKTLYMQKPVSIEEATRKNLKLSLIELGLSDGSRLVVADTTSPSATTFELNFV